MIEYAVWYNHSTETYTLFESDNDGDFGDFGQELMRTENAELARKVCDHLRDGFITLATDWGDE